MELFKKSLICIVLTFFSITLFAQEKAIDIDGNEYETKILKKEINGELKESKGSESEIAPLMEMALIKYNRVMNASRRGSFSYSEKNDLNECIGLLDKVIDIYPKYGEPFGLRANMYFIRGQVERNSSDLDKALKDFNDAIRIGAKDTSNHTGWLKNIDLVKMVKNKIK